MQNDMLDECSCCVFVYDGRISPRFWGKNTLQDLYVILIDDGIVVDCKRIGSFDLTPVVLEGLGDMAIELLDEVPIGSKVVMTGDRVAIF